MTRPDKDQRRRQREGSFTLLEVTIALALMAFLIVEVSGVMGNSIVFSDYGRNVTQATWLARRVLSQVQYYWHTKPFPDLETKTEGKFEDFPEYSWSLEIKEWEFPFEKLLTGGLNPGGAEGEDKEESSSQSQDAGLAQMIEAAMKQVFGDEPKFMTAHVEVFWAEGAQRNSTSMTYLLTNQKKVDEALAQLKPVYDKLTRPPPKKKDAKGKSKGGNNPTGQPGGGNNPPQEPGGEDGE